MTGKTITCEHFDELWAAVLAKCDELLAQPNRGTSRSVGMLRSDGRGVSSLASLYRPDGTRTTWHVEAYRAPFIARVDLRVEQFTDNCDQFWAAKLADRSGAIVSGCEHYRIGDEAPSGMRGFGGRRFVIRMLATGEVVETTNLWFGGVIPPAWRDRFPPTAEFIEPAGFVFAADPAGVVKLGAGERAERISDYALEG